MSAKQIGFKTSLDNVWQVWGWIVLVWALYRYFLKLPEWADEFIFKPLVFALPVLWYVTKKEKLSLGSVGITTKNLFTSIYTGLGFGFLFAVEGLISNYLKYGKITITPIAAFGENGMALLLLLSLATAFSEELLSRGFVFNKLLTLTGKLPYAAILSTLMFVFIHVPILATSLKLQGSALLVFFITDFILGFANALLFYNTRSLVAPILVHVFWNMTVALYL